MVNEYTSYLMLLYRLTYLLVLNNLHHKYTGNFIIDTLNKKIYLYLFKTIHTNSERKCKCYRACDILRYLYYLPLFMNIKITIYFKDESEKHQESGKFYGFRFGAEESIGFR